MVEYPNQDNWRIERATTKMLTLTTYTSNPKLETQRATYPGWDARPLPAVSIEAACQLSSIPTRITGDLKEQQRKF